MLFQMQFQILTVRYNWGKYIIFHSPKIIERSYIESNFRVENSSDEESSTDQSPPTIRRYIPVMFKPRKVAAVDDTPIFRKHGGKRRLRRYQNRECMLNSIIFTNIFSFQRYNLANSM